mgnify:CR=1 FL=1
MAMWKVAIAPVVIVAPLLGGWLADALDVYWPCFAIAGVFAVVTAVLALRLDEPRDQGAAGGEVSECPQPGDASSWS